MFGLNTVGRFDQKILKYNALWRISVLGQHTVDRFDPNILKLNALWRISGLGLNNVDSVLIISGE